jgi:hypothetical protein
VWFDVLHEGPVPSVGAAELRRIRAAFLTSDGGAEPESVLRRFEDLVLRHHGPPGPGPGPAARRRPRRPAGRLPHPAPGNGGRARVLAGKADHLALNGVDRWIGGGHLHGHGVRWRWDEGIEALTAS